MYECMYVRAIVNALIFVHMHVHWIFTLIFQTVFGAAAQVKKFRMENMAPVTSKLNIDGEVYDIQPGQPLEVEVLPRFLTYLGGW